MDKEVFKFFDICIYYGFDFGLLDEILINCMLFCKGSLVSRSIKLY